MGTILWSDPEKSAILTKDNGNTLEISIGSLLTYPGRPMGIKVTGFTSKPSDTRGPIGIVYLPWRGDRWATVVWTFKGDLRHLIAFPVGISHYGEQVNWNNVELLKGDPLLQIQMFGLEATN